MNNYRDLYKRVAYLEDLLSDELMLEKEDGDKDSVIRKVGNKWKILKKNRKDYWDADYKTKADAEAALRAYWANKRECRKRILHPLVFEGFTTESGKDLVRNVQDFLIKIFGHTLYFDHIEDESADLFYKGNLVATFDYNNKNDEITVTPANPNLDQVIFYDTSEYEIQDYLSDLILGDIQ
jgi:hypothetical protein